MTFCKKNLLQASVIMLIGVGIFLTSPCYAEAIKFSGLDLNAENGLLFTAETSNGVYTWQNLYKTNLIKDLKNDAASEGEPELLTCFPEKLDVFQDGRVLQIRNSDGVFLYSKSEKTLTKISSSPSLYSSPENSAKIRDNLANISVSPDGNWICYFEKSSSAKGSVILSSTKTGERFILSQDAEFSFDKIPVTWCPDSSTLVYEKNNHLYFINPENGFSDTLLDERYRSIGPGTIGNVCWASSKKLVYICHDLVFSILIHELYTRALYSELVGVGDICGRLPSSFDGERDKFWINENCDRIVLVENSRTLWYMEMSGTDVNYVKTLFSYPFVTVPGTASNFHVFWTPVSAGSQIPIVWIELFRSGTKESHVYRLVKKEGVDHAWFEVLPLPVSVDTPKLSSNGKYLSFAGDDFIAVYNIFDWKEIARISGEPIVSYSWIDSFSMYVGGQKTVRYWNFNKNVLNMVFLSSAEKYAWDGESGRVLASCSMGNYFFNDNTKIWDKTDTVISRKTVSRNSFWRVFVDSSRNDDYQNAIYVRSLAETNTTRPLLKSFYNPNPDVKKIALVFDALDNSDGIAKILDILNKYGLKATFFLNGEFIRRFPSVVQEISNSGHECASMFYTVANLASDTFVPDEKYIMRGLARNEDEFFELTGNELSLAWHAPVYINSSVISDAGKNAGYTYVNRSVDTGDTKTIEEAAKTGIPYISSSTLVENLANNFSNNEIIPVSCGLSLGTRPEYLYDKLDILISAILGQGYKIVPVSDIIWK
jgi:peptidoglycan/xylan/chitin deacetylase (PgdA/CDA1 family)